MTQEEIIESIQTILEVPFVAQKMVSVFYGIYRDKNNQFQTAYYNETVDLLIKLYQRLVAVEEKEFFWKIINDSFLNKPKLIGQPNVVECLVKENTNYVFMFLVRIGNTDAALNFFDSERNTDGSLVAVLSTISSLLTHEPIYFRKEHLDRLRISMSKLIDNINVELNYEKRKGEKARIVALNQGGFANVKPPSSPSIPRQNYIKASSDEIKHAVEYTNNIIQQIKKVKLNILKADFEGINQEINQDKEELKRRISQFRFNEELNQCLDKFDMDYYNADGFDFKSCIGHIRTFTEKLVISIAEKIQFETKLPSTNGVASMGTARQYLRDGRIDFLSQKQDDFLGYFYAFASDDKIGAHSLTSNREHARIIRNTAIEIGLFLVQLLDKKYKNEKILI
jgi:hypothetical protein